MARPDTIQMTNLASMLRCFMAMERWSMRTLAPQIGISSATLQRVCAGYAMDADTLVKIFNWMFAPRSKKAEHGDAA